MFKLILIFTATVLASLAWGADPSVNTVDKKETEFVRSAILLSMLEVRSSEIAIKRGLNNEEREFAQQVISDHKKSHKELVALADRKGITLPSALDEKQQDKLDKLAQRNDKDFAERYLELQISAHKDSIDLFEGQANNGKDADLKAFAISTLPTFKNHLEHAKKLEEKH